MNIRAINKTVPLLLMLLLGLAIVDGEARASEWAGGSSKVVMESYSRLPTLADVHMPSA